MVKKLDIPNGHVMYRGRVMDIDDAVTRLHSLPDGATLSSSEAAIFLNMNIKTLDRYREPPGGGPLYMQGGSYGAKGTNQAITYHKSDLMNWQVGIKVPDSMVAAVRKGQMFRTLTDLADTHAFYIDEHGQVAGMVERHLMTTVIERLGGWEIAWMPASEAASKIWSNLSDHREFANEVKAVLSSATQAIDAGLEGTEISEVVPTISKPARPPRRDL